MNFKKHVPNTITLLNLFCGCVALVFVAKQDFEMAFNMVCLGIFFDYFDGFFARLFQVSGALGLQLDSLADMVTSGVVPGYVMFSLMSKSQFEISSAAWFPFLGFVITLGSCYRLAFFNIDTRQSTSFIGLPTPANALFVLSLPLVLKYSDSLFLLEILTNQWVLVFITFLSAYIMNAELPLFSLKIKKLDLKQNRLQFAFLFYSILVLILLNYVGIPIIILSYILVSILNNRYYKDEKKEC